MRPDQPSLIRSRIQITTATSLLLITSTFILLRAHLGLGTSCTLRLLGLSADPRAALAALVLTALFFLGPLFERLLVERGYPGKTRRAPSVLDLRNYVFAPLSEELLFRACLVPVALLTWPSEPLGGDGLRQDDRVLPVVLSEAAFSSLVFTTPLYFAVAHVHRLIESKICWPEESITDLLFVTFIQFGYTSLFGFYTTFLFLRLGSLPACILAHVLCNWISLPRLWGRVGTENHWGIHFSTAPSSSQSTKLETGQAWAHSAVNRIRSSWKGIGLTLAYYLLLFAGMAGFWRFVGILTVSEQGLARRSENGPL